MKRALFAIGLIPILAITATATPPRKEKPEKQFIVNAIVTGKVTDANGVGLAGVTIAAKGSTKTTVSGSDGSFSLDVPSNVKTLLFSYVGMEAQEVKVGSGNLHVSLKSAETALNDVVVVGYTTQKRANLTGAVSTVSGQTLTQRPAPNAANLLQGRVPGLQVTQPTSEPGRDNPGLMIRGRSSFSGGTSNDPLILIDGVTGSLNNLSPDDIDNITVLKDAASASIYGARAANGVILVTTKKGRRGQTTLTYRTNVGRHSAIGLP